MAAVPARPRKPTSTSAFGVGRRENHDASAFYGRFGTPTVSPDDTVNPPGVVDQVYVGDARDMRHVQPSSVALVVTSPPYFAGKAYEAVLGEGHVPASYVEYLDMLSDVFAECVAKLESGGRIAVNVANLGRKPYRSLAADVIAILQDRLGLLLRGEVVWVKAKGAGGSCAWGSFRSPTNPVLRDVTERVVIASKGRFDRAGSAPKRRAADLPHQPTITRDEFMEATTDVWDLAPESATRVGHPAPFPVELPQRLIELYTWKGDLVLDPFLGSGTTAVAAVRTGRHYVGYDTDRAYVDAARARIAAEVPAADRPAEGAVATAASWLAANGYRDVTQIAKPIGGVDADFGCVAADGTPVVVIVSGAFVSGRAGLRRADVLWRTIGGAAVLRQLDPGRRVLVLTTDLPQPGTAGDATLRAAIDGGMLEVALLA